MRPALSKHRILLKSSQSISADCTERRCRLMDRALVQCHVKADLITTKFTLETQRDLHGG